MPDGPTPSAPPEQPVQEGAAPLDGDDRVAFLKHLSEVIRYLHSRGVGGLAFLNHAKLLAAGLDLQTLGRFVPRIMVEAYVRSLGTLPRPPDPRTKMAFGICLVARALYPGDLEEYKQRTIDLLVDFAAVSAEKAG